MFDLDHTMEDLCGKDIVYYRAIVGRPPEILSVLQCPCTTKEIPLFLRNDVRRVSRFHDSIQRYIPEVQDLQKYMKTAIHNRTTKRKSKLLLSYYPHIAVYDPKNKRVVTLNGLMPHVLYEELAPQGRDEEIKNAIHTYYSLYQH